MKYFSLISSWHKMYIEHFPFLIKVFVFFSVLIWGSQEHKIVCVFESVS